ncbi:M28 family peptidase [Oscillatoriales cyanobacterium LEGE 11467]|uniref:M28 family peptidase n=1 Tax=Zarconia navalis LEGE 11467 TaxID=1828826 RepID=A0A928Z6V5_9CYAN|nr:M28 family peptidase [Zarconia navalis]MBE9039910.1 M28 family peptidase [Zarconia navalis LEGE 11467]
MGKRSRNNRFKVKLASRGAIARLSILLALLSIVSIWGWFSIFWMPGRSYSGELPPLKSSEIELANVLEQEVIELAKTIGIRNFLEYDRLNESADFLERSLTQMGYEVKRQKYEVQGQAYYNIEAEKRGTQKPDEIIVIGGHYDSVMDCPGANDNATGTAATLELARIFASKLTDRTLRFVAFTNEEPPFFWEKEMGSLVYATRSHEQNENIVAMLSMETMGYFSDERKSQNYPFPLGLFFPDRGNFITFVGNLDSGDLVRQTIESFRRHTQFPSVGGAFPSQLPGVGWSDHWSFWQKGYKALMVTDTAPFRYIHYHTLEDTPDKVDFQKLARVVSGLAKVIVDLDRAK